jgi:hypothetical protein
MSDTPDTTKEFEVAIDVDKSLVALATAVLTVTISFSKEIVGNATSGEEVLLALSWVAFFLSILFGVWLFYAAIGSISDIGKGKNHSIYDSNTAIPMGGQQLLFLIAVVCTAIFGILVV